MQNNFVYGKATEYVVVAHPIFIAQWQGKHVCGVHRTLLHGGAVFAQQRCNRGMSSLAESEVSFMIDSGRPGGHGLCIGQRHPDALDGGHLCRTLVGDDEAEGGGDVPERKRCTAVGNGARGIHIHIVAQELRLLLRCLRECVGHRHGGTEGFSTARHGRTVVCTERSDGHDRATVILTAR